MQKFIVRNDKGEPILLNELELHKARWLGQALYNQHGGTETIKNALGYEATITTLTQVLKKVSMQKFFEIAPADFMPMNVGEGAWNTQLTAYRSFAVADAFETGIVNTGQNSTRLASADAGVDTVNIKTYPWAKSITWSIFDLEYAAKQGNYDLISQKEKARKKNWDLGIQRLAFLGAQGMNSSTGTCIGWLSQPGVTVNTSRITAPISGLTTSQLNTFCAGVLEDYRANVVRTAWPSIFSMPESDYNGLASQASADFPIKTKLQVLEETFKLITRNAGFKILPNAYGDAAYHADVAAIAGKQVYVLASYDEESYCMHLPIDYQSASGPQTPNGFGYEQVAFGQFSGGMLLRPLEMLYYQY